MVDFRNKLKKVRVNKEVDPIEIYSTLDRASDKGPLRPVQIDILQNWFKVCNDFRDVIVKLHTGQGKTLIGLLILQSKLNQSKGPALYLCPNKYLVKQTEEQAKQFGINVKTSENEIPSEFLDNKTIYITTVQKLFNGLTKFKLKGNSIPVSSIVIDDSHACIDAIRDTFIIRINSEHEIYKTIIAMFSVDIENQGNGTYREILDGESNSFLPIPYWNWIDNSSEVSALLNKHRDEDELLFQWPLLKDIIKECRCFISGEYLEISPYINPIELFGSYNEASHRVFMSATVHDDSFLVRSLRVSADAIMNPLTYSDEKWSGEKMILIPSLIDDNLTRDEVIQFLGKERQSLKFGIVVLTPSSSKALHWQNAGSRILIGDNIFEEIDKLKNEKADKTVVIVNRYDGIDLPDNTCRILIMDSKPFFQTLVDLYEETCRNKSKIITIKIAQKIEQGLGRGVRGEKDFCVIIIIGAEIVKLIRSQE